MNVLKHSGAVSGLSRARSGAPINASVRGQRRDAPAESSGVAPVAVRCNRIPNWCRDAALQMFARGGTFRSSVDGVGAADEEPSPRAKSAASRMLHEVVVRRVTESIACLNRLKFLANVPRRKRTVDLLVQLHHSRNQKTPASWATGFSGRQGFDDDLLSDCD